jgi:FKBP12-rapamycin complex-associated protein
MEVCGITGTFSRSCEVTMEVLRDNRESLMAVLEAFVYDPLIAWRLTATNQPGGRVNSANATESEDVQTRKMKANENEIFDGESALPGDDVWGGRGDEETRTRADAQLRAARARSRMTARCWLLTACGGN